MMNTPPARRTSPPAIAFLAGLLALAGCSSAVMQVVDADNGYQPIAGATVTRYALPHRRGDAYSTTPADVQTADANGTVVLHNDAGRFVVAAPGKASASLSSTFMPKNIEVGLSAAPAK